MQIEQLRENVFNVRLAADLDLRRLVWLFRALEGIRGESYFSTRLADSNVLFNFYLLMFQHSVTRPFESEPTLKGQSGRDKSGVDSATTVAEHVKGALKHMIGLPAFAEMFLANRSNVKYLIYLCTVTPRQYLLANSKVFWSWPPKSSSSTTRCCALLWASSSPPVSPARKMREIR